MRKLLISILFYALYAPSEVSNQAIVKVATAPSGACVNGVAGQLVISTGVIYTCQAGTWATWTTASSVATGSGYQIPAYPSAAGTALSPSNITTDATGNNLNVPGAVAVSTTVSAGAACPAGTASGTICSDNPPKVGGTTFTTLSSYVSATSQDTHSTSN